MKQRKVILFSSLICWYKRVLISIGMMMKAWIRLITKIILPIRVFPFLMPYLAFTGKAFGKVAFNLSINAAASGGALLQQAWFDVQLKKQFAIRVGKFKTPFSHAYLTTLGETLLPQLPVSLTSSVILPYSLNAVTPNIGTGFDLGC